MKDELNIAWFVVIGFHCGQTGMNRRDYLKPGLCDLEECVLIANRPLGQLQI